MGQAKQYLEEHQEEIEMKDLLQELIDTGHLENPALGITRQVIAQGRQSLSERQAYVFQTQVWKQYVLEECSSCEHSIPWSEMYEALSNGGRCGYCVHKAERLLKE
jgi:hypothetical protein